MTIQIKAERRFPVVRFCPCITYLAEYFRVLFSILIKVLVSEVPEVLFPIYSSEHFLK